MAKENVDRGMSIGGVIWLVFILLAVLIVFFGSWYTIQPGTRGVIVRLGNPQMDAKIEGFHFKVPLIDSVVKMNVKTQKYETDASSASKDLQTVHTKIAVNFHATPDAIPKLYKEVGVGYADNLIQPAVQEVVKASTAQFTAEELITRRAEVKDKIQAGLHDRLVTRDIVIEAVSIVNFDFSDSFNAAVESKVTAEQTALAAKNKLEQIKYEAQQRIEQAQGEATAIQIQANAINAQGGSAYVQLQAINRWDGKLPTMMISGGTVPFINIPTGEETN